MKTNKKELLKQFQKEVSDFKRVTDKRLYEFSKLISDFFEDIAISLDSFDYDGYGVRRVSSNVGSELFFMDIETMEALPHEADLCGKGFYLHRDINAYVRFMNCKKSLQAIRIIPKFLENAAAVMQKLRNEFEKIDEGGAV